MDDASLEPAALFSRALASQRIHSAYLVSGPGPEPLALALRFVRGLACTGAGERPCEACDACRRSGAPNDVALDGAGKKGPLFRHVGEHPDLLVVARGADDTRIRIAQIRALQMQLRLRSAPGARRAALLEGAEWLNAEAQNALLRILEEPPPETTLVLVANTAAGLLATLRSRCQRVVLPAERPLDFPPAGASESVRSLADRFEALPRMGIPEILDWAEAYRGGRSESGEAVLELLETASAWLHHTVVRRAREGDQDLDRALDAFRSVRAARRGFVQRNANSQMVAERTLLALREVAAS
jgi:DNA polymerase-3 subunit delta'